MNTDRVPSGETVRGLADFLAPRWKGKTAIANPLFGTTSYHVASLFSVWGEARAKRFLEGIKKNGCRVVSSNGEVRRLVSQGEVAFGLTDTDDVVSRREGRNLACDLIFPDKDGEGTLVFPNTLALIKGCPNPDNAKKLYDWLLTKELSLCMSLSAQIPLSNRVKAPDGRYALNMIRAIEVDWARVSEVRDECVRLLEEKLVR